MNVASLSPVVIISPAMRAGTTLVQRLLCSARNALIYGDIVGQEMEFFANYVLARDQMLQCQQFQAVPMREAVLRGDVADFITPLAPTLTVHVGGLQRAALAWWRECAEEAAAQGRPITGWKLAGANAQSLPVLARWFPKALWIWVERNIADCFRSAKAAGMVQGGAHATHFAQSANAARAAFHDLSGKKLILNYEELTTHPSQTVARLEQFTGAVEINASVFDVRVNHPGTLICKPPAELTAEESQVFSEDATPNSIHTA